MKTSDPVKTLTTTATDRAEALDRLILQDAEPQLETPCDTLICEDSTGALTLAALAALLTRGQAGTRVLARLRSRAAAQQIRELVDSLAPSAASRLLVVGLDTPALDLETALEESGITPQLVLGRLPKTLAALDDWARATARHTAVRGGEISLCLGGNTKHMTLTMNRVLEQSFSQVWAGRGKGKFRALHAEQPRPETTAHAPERTELSAGELVGAGGVFSGGREDRGGAFLAEHACALLGELPAEAPLKVLDLGCGNGSVSLRLLDAARTLGRGVELTATDLDADAVRSASLTLAPFATGSQRAQITWDDAGANSPAGTFDLVLLNPPFHQGTRLDATMIRPLLESAARLLVPGGRLLLVHNSHLRYRPQLEERFETVEQLGRNATFTVLSARKTASEIV